MRPISGDGALRTPPICAAPHAPVALVGNLPVCPCRSSPGEDTNVSESSGRGGVRHHSWVCRAVAHQARLLIVTSEAAQAVAHVVHFCRATSRCRLSDLSADSRSAPLGRELLSSRESIGPARGSYRASWCGSCVRFRVGGIDGLARRMARVSRTRAPRGVSSSCS